MADADASDPDRRILVPPLSDAPEAVRGGLRHEVGGAAFATRWQVVLYADGPVDRQGLTRQVEAVLERIDAEMSVFRRDSDISRFNRADPGAFVSLPQGLLEVVAHALDIATLSDGAFDPALLDIVDAWGFGTVEAAPEGPGRARLAKLRRRGDWRRLQPTRQGMVRPEGVRLDLSGIAKGYAVDRVVEALRARPGVLSALVEIGGELKSFGICADGQPYWVEIERPSALPRTLVALYDMAVATSGDTRRFFIQNGVRLSHTMDATTGAPVRTDIRTISVFDPLCWRADALATALMVMGAERAMRFAQSHAIPCLIRLSNGTEHLSPALEEWL